MKWYWWILIVILGLNVLAIAMISFLMAGDWLAERRQRSRERAPRAGDSSRT
jgi:hypothetical protein